MCRPSKLIKHLNEETGSCGIRENTHLDLGAAIMAMRKPKKTIPDKPESDGVRFLYDRHIAGDAEQTAAYQEHLDNAEIARTICGLRTKAGLSQRALARLVNTTASAICRLEDADYEGHSLSMLRRIAAALDRRIEVRFVPNRGKLTHA